MSEGIADLMTDPRESDRVLSLDCPNTYYAYPRLTQLAPIPPQVRATLDDLWSRSVHQGQTVRVYRFAEVVVAKEGLVFDASGRLIACTRTYHSDEDIRDAHRRVGAFLASGARARVARGILAKSRGAENYGHFIVEMLPRAWLARHRLGLHDWPAVIHESAGLIGGRAAEALRLAGFGHDQVVATGTEPVLFDELVVVDGLTAHTLYLSPFVMQCLDAVGAGVPPGPHRRLYVPRRPALQRDFAEEAEIARRLRRNGFHAVETAELSVAEQIAAFKGAEIVVGVMGAALTNIVFCRPGTSVVSFTPGGAAEVLFWMLAQGRRLDYHEVRCPEVGPQLGSLPWDRLIGVGPSKVEEIVGAALRARPQMPQ